MSKKLELKKCKICRQELYFLSGLKFMVDGQPCCSDCLEKKGGIQCRWCHKNLNPNRYSDGLGKVSFVFAGSSIWGEEINASTVCCTDCLHKFEYDEEGKRIGSKKKCQNPGCHAMINRHEEAVGRKECQSCEEKKKEQENRKRAKEHEGEFEKYEQVQAKAQSWWSSLSSHEREQECERVVENMKQEKYWANNVREGEGSGWACDGSLWIIENGKFTSRSPHLVPIQIVEEFQEKEIGFCDNKAIEFFNSRMVKVKKDDSDNPPLEIEEGERIGEKKLEIVNNNKSNNKVLVIDLKNIKKLTLRNNNSLEIEFNSSIQDNQSVSHWYSVNQVMTDKQVNNNQELQKVRNYLQKNNKVSLNQRELTEFFNSSSVPVEAPKDINRLLKIGGGTILVFGVLGWLLVVSKRKLKKH